MTRAGIGPHSLPGDHLPRVLLKSGVPKTGYVDGAWWPYSDDLATELPVLLTALNSVLGAVERAVYHLGEWSSPPGELAFAGRVVRQPRPLCGMSVYSTQALVSVHCSPASKRLWPRHSRPCG
ncbi:DUF5994 family protein [Nocardia sp. GP40]